MRRLGKNYNKNNALNKKCIFLFLNPAKRHSCLVKREKKAMASKSVLAPSKGHPIRLQRPCTGWGPDAGKELFAD